MKNGNLHEYLGGDLYGSVNRTILVISLQTTTCGYLFDDVSAGL